MIIPGPQKSPGGKEQPAEEPAFPSESDCGKEGMGRQVVG